MFWRECHDLQPSSVVTNPQPASFAYGVHKFFVIIPAEAVKKQVAISRKPFDEIVTGGYLRTHMICFDVREPPLILSLLIRTSITLRIDLLGIFQHHAIA